ncbi:MAG: hypothetical protein OXG33_10610 [Chloroflexi bacterium]|nr:hypothetical protein [Chloroflexota bacterium]
MIVYCVLLVGRMVRLSLGSTLPIPWLMERLVVQVLLQLRVVEPPMSIAESETLMSTDGQTMMFPASGSR